MAAVRSTFGSCLDTSSSFFTSPVNKLSVKCGSAAFLDKVLKTADPIFDLAGVIAEAQGASDETLKGIGKGRALAKTGRDAMAFFNIFQGIIPALINNMKNIYALISGLLTCETPQPVNLKATPKRHNEKAVSSEEKWAALAENVGKGVGAASFIAGFGVCRPIATYEKYISRTIDPTASKIGKAFPTVMMVNHIGGIVGHSSALIFQKLAFDREVALYGFNLDVQLEFQKKIIENGMALAGKGLELVADVVHHAGVAAPAGFRIPLQLSVGVLSIAKEWLKEEKE